MNTEATFKEFTESMAESATGFAVVIDGILDINTIGETASVAASFAMAQRGFMILSNCNDITCDCKIGVLAKLIPNAKVIPVVVMLMVVED